MDCNSFYRCVSMVYMCISLDSLSVTATKTQWCRWRRRRLPGSLCLEGLESFFSLGLDLLQSLLDLLGLAGVVGARGSLGRFFLGQNVVGGRKTRGGLERCLEVLGNVDRFGFLSL